MFENILENLRILLYVLLALLGFMLFQAWQHDHPPVAEPEPQAKAMSIAQSTPPSAAVPATTAPAQPTAITAGAKQTTGQLITVTTDVLEVQIDTQGGDMVQSKLLHYPESLGSSQSFILLNNDEKTRYIAESGLLSPEGPDTTAGQALFTAAQTTYTLAPDQNQLQVTLNWNKNGLSIAKIFTFTRNSYEVKVSYKVDNQSSQSWSGQLYTQLARTDTPPASHGGLVNLATYFGAAVGSEKKAFQKITFKDMKNNNFNQVTQDGWAAMIQHYFIGAWIPDKTATSTYYSQVTPTGLYSIGMLGTPFTVTPKSTGSTEAKLYIGPALTERLEKAAPGLQLTIDYGWFWFISAAIFWLMQKIYNVVGNWGWSIVLVTVIIKLLFYQLSAKSYRSMSMLKNLQPKIEALKERFGEDKQKLTQATLALYKEEKVNPMSGCLPILIQIPVFIALYWVLIESVELRQAPFILWIHDLSQHDPYYILPVLMGISMFLQQRLNPPPPDPLQAKIMMLMPVIFTVLFANFPAGLMLYWFVNNTLSFLQQWHIMHRLNKETHVKSR